MEFITFDEMIESGKATKQQKQLLNLERFNLLPEDIASAVNEERELGEFPRPLVPVPQEEFDTYKDFMKDLSKTGFMGDIQNFSDEDFAKLFYTLDRTQNFFTDSDVYKEVGAIVGGITGAQVLNSPGVTGNLNSKLSNLVTKFPRIGRMIGAFIGGAGGSTPGVAASENSISDKFKEVIGFGAREAAGEGAFQLLAKLFGGRFKKIFTGKEGQALETAARSSQKLLTEAGATLTPARLSKSTTIDMIEQLAEVSFFGGQGIREAGEKAVDVSQELLGKYLNDLYYPGTAEINFVKNFSKRASFENVDDLMKNFLLKGQDFYDTAVNASYKNLNKVTKSLIGNNKIVDSKNILAAFDRKVRLSKGQLEAADPTVVALRNYILNISEQGKGGVDFVTAKNMRTYFLQKKNKKLHCLRNFSYHLCTSISRRYG